MRVTVSAAVYDATPFFRPLVQAPWSGTSYGGSNWGKYTRPPIPFHSVWCPSRCSLNRPSAVTSSPSTTSPYFVGLAARPAPAP